MGYLWDLMCQASKYILDEVLSSYEFITGREMRHYHGMVMQVTLVVQASNHNVSNSGTFATYQHHQ